MNNIFMELAKNEWNLFSLFFISIIALIVLSEFILKNNLLLTFYPIMEANGSAIANIKKEIVICSE